MPDTPPPFGTWAPGEPPPTTSLQTVLAALYEPEQLVTLAEALGGGSFPGVGTIENDTMDLVDSVGPGFPLNIPFVLPSNMVKHQKAWLSFKLLAYRTYSNAINNSSSSGGFVTSTILPPVGAISAASVTRHSVDPDTALTNATLVACCATNVLATPVTRQPFIDAPSPTIANVMASPPNTGTAITAVNVSLVDGIRESTVATGVTVLIDGVDYTSQLGGPFNADTFELDITMLGWAKTSGIHTCQLTSTQLGRIVGWIRNNYIVNPFK